MPPPHQRSKVRANALTFSFMACSRLLERRRGANAGAKGPDAAQESLMP